MKAHQAWLEQPYDVQAQAEAAYNEAYEEALDSGEAWDAAIERIFTGEGSDDTNGDLSRFQEYICSDEVKLLTRPMREEVYSKIGELAWWLINHTAQEEAERMAEERRTCG